MTGNDLIPASLLMRKAVVYVHQSTQSQVMTNLESQRRQYDLVDIARGYKPEPVQSMPVRLVLVDTDKQARDAARERDELADAMMRSPDDIVRFVSAIELAQNTGVLPVMGDEPIFNHMEAALSDQCSSIRKLTGSMGREIEAFAKRKGVLQ